MPVTKRGNTCYLLVIDVYTKFVFLYALKEQTALAVARSLLKLFCTVGFPRIVGSDNGTEFVNEIMQEVVRVCKIDHRLISAYHHRANGIAERAIRTTSDAIYKQLEGQVDQWDRYLDATQLFYNLKESESTGSTPYSLVFARKANALEDFSNIDENPFSVECLQQRLDYMNVLVYPAVV
jgi:transposase InsO family protein